MATNVIQSAGLRFLQKFGVAFFWALVVGVVFGGLVYFRVERSDLEGELRWHVYPRLWLESLEDLTVDWRARERGAVGDRPDQVVLVNVDEDTLNNARESEHPEWAMRPWPRELVGQLADQAIREGASMVFIDESFADTSAHQCTPCRGEDVRSDDQKFSELVKKQGRKVVIGFIWRRDTRRPADRPLTPVLLKVGEAPTDRETLPLLQKVLLQRTTAYLVTNAGTHEVWAGATNEVKARELAATFELKGTPVTRSLTAADDALQVDGELLLQKLTRATITGVDPDLAPEAGSIDAPVPSLLSGEVPIAAMRVVPDSDGVVRSVPLWIKGGRAETVLIPGLALFSTPEVPKSMSVSEGVLHVDDRPGVPVDTEGFLSLSWGADEVGRSGRGTMKRAVPAWRLLVNHEDDTSGRGVRHHDNDLKGRIVMLVDDRTTLRFDTPVGRLSRGAIWAQALSDVVNGQGITRVPADRDLWLTFAFSLVGAILAIGWSSLVRRPGWLAWAATLLLVLGVHALIARQLYVTQSRQVAMAAPVLACSITFLAALGYARTLEQSLREFMLRALGGAVRADVFATVERDLKLMRPERRELTVFFSDIEGFTSVSNQKEPQLVVDVLREYLEEMTEVVLDRDGHVDKYLGDGLMAFWGAPVALPDDAQQACEAALLMHEGFDARREEWEKKLGHALVLRAGLESGDAVVGEMGTIHRVNYTVMGEPVATAFRLESLAKRYGVRTLAGESIRDEAHETFLFRQIDTVKMGRDGQPMKIYELLGRTAEAEKLGWLPQYEAAFALWNSGKFDEAQKAFAALKEQLPKDDIVARYEKQSALKDPLSPWGRA